MKRPELKPGQTLLEYNTDLPQCLPDMNKLYTGIEKMLKYLDTPDMRKIKSELDKNETELYNIQTKLNFLLTDKEKDVINELKKDMKLGKDEYSSELIQEIFKKYKVKILEALDYEANNPDIEDMGKLDFLVKYRLMEKMKALYPLIQTSKGKYENAVEEKFPDFVMRYFGVVQMILFGKNINRLWDMLARLEKIRDGQASFDQVEKDLGEELQDEYIKPITDKLDNPDTEKPKLTSFEKNLKGKLTKNKKKKRTTKLTKAAKRKIKRRQKKKQKKRR